MKGFLQEYGIIMVVVAVVLGMLAFGKTGYAKSIQDAILGSTDHIVETGENITKKEVHVTAGDTLDIEGTKYIVLEQRENSKALVVTAKSIGKKRFQPDYNPNTYLRPDEQNANTYENSTMDNYLENEWYNSLSSTIKTAISVTNIKQDSYSKNIRKYVKQEKGPNGQVYNTISRHVFLPSVSEIDKVVDLEWYDKVEAFVDDIYGMWTRDSYKEDGGAAMFINGNSKKLGNNYVYLDYGTRPAFVIDLSKVDYKTVGHTDYK